MVSIEALQLHAGWSQAIEADASAYRAYNGIHPLITKHPTEVVYIIIAL
jgi:hypothetical protein